MKERFTTIDLVSVLRELNERLLGMRVANVYDIDQKTYLIKLAKPDKKVMLLFESGCRIHTTEFEWPKHLQPSGFSMKLRKHLRSRRLVSISQLGVDRVVDLQFGSNEAAYHIIIEVYDRGNVVLTDYAYTILSILRTRTDADADIRFAAREIYSMETIKKEQPSPTTESVQEILASAKVGDQLRHLLNPHFVYGSALLSHCLRGAGFSDTVKVGNGVDPVSDLPRVVAVLQEADALFRAFKEEPRKGILIQKRQVQPRVEPLDAASGGGGKGDEGEDDVLTNIEFHPMLFRQHEKSPYKELETFNKAVDEFFSSRSSQKQDLKAFSVKKTAVKKLDNIRKDHFKRIENLQKTQEEDVYKAQLVEMNTELVSKAILVIRSAVANAMDWGDIQLLVKDAQSRGDPVASAIAGLKLKTNEITLLLHDPCEEWEESDSGGDEEEDEVDEGAVKQSKKVPKKKGTKVDIDLGLSAFSNATRYYGHKKQAARKEKKTMDASEKAIKSAEKKAKQTLKEASMVAKIQKARKVHWFEKFYWFISSENYLVIGGRDQQQNEVLVKRYLKEGDLYVHADMHGATSVVIKNPQGGMVPPKTLNEAGYMAVCYSSAWEARIITSAWWVYHNQVSKTAPTGEYLTTGSFMIRGKKNFLPPCQLVLGFGFLFRVEDTCIPNHLHERKVKGTEEENVSSEAGKMSTSVDNEEEITIEDDGDESEGEEGGTDVAADREGVGEVESSEEEEGAEFPDTSVTIAHVGGDMYELQRGTSTSSSTTEEKQLKDTQEDMKTHQHLSAKQKRELRKQRQNRPSGINTPTNGEKNLTKSQQKKTAQPPPIPQQPQQKRGQKFKQKKAKEKYKDQDEEEKQFMMEFLGSAGPQKEVKRGKKGKGKKSFDTTQSSNPKLKYRQKDKGKKTASLAEQAHKQKPPTIVSVIHEEPSVISEDDGRSHTEESSLGEKDQDPIMEGKEEMNADTERVCVDGEGLEVEEEYVERRGEGEVQQNDGEPVVGGDDTEQVDDYGNGIEQAGNYGNGDGGIEQAGNYGNGGDEQAGNCGDGGTEQADNYSNGGIEQDGNGDGGDDGMEQVGGGVDEESDEEEKKALLAEENIHQLEEAEREQLTMLDALTGCPVAEDVLMYAIPVCGPYSSMLNYKYKVKLIPGNNRRGKAAKAALHKFTQSREALQREKDLLKSVKDNDLSRYIPGKVKMSLSQSHKQQHR